MRTLRAVVGQTLALTSPLSGAREASQRLISLDKDMLFVHQLGNLVTLHSSFEDTRNSLQYCLRNSQSVISAERYAEIARHTRSMPRFFRESARVLNDIADRIATPTFNLVIEHCARLINALCMQQRNAQKALENVRECMQHLSQYRATPKLTSSLTSLLQQKTISSLARA